MNGTRRGMFKSTLAALVLARWSRFPAAAAAEELKVPDNVPVDKFDFETKGIEGWTTVDGQWAVEDMAGAPSGSPAPVPRAAREAVHGIVGPLRPDSRGGGVGRLQTLSGRGGGPGGLVVPLPGGQYYLLRAH